MMEDFQTWRGESHVNEIEISVDNRVLTESNNSNGSTHIPIQPQNIPLTSNSDLNQDQSLHTVPESYILQNQMMSASAEGGIGENEMAPPTDHCYTANNDFQDKQPLGTSHNSRDDWLAQHSHLQAQILEPSTSYQLLAESSTQLRTKLNESELALADAQDSCRRLQSDFDSRISFERNKIWEMENELHALRSEKDEYKNTLINLNKELVNINGKVAELCEIDGSTDENGSYNQNSVNANAWTCDPNQRYKTAESISQINFKLDKALQQKRGMNSSIFYQNGAGRNTDINPIPVRYSAMGYKTGLVHQENETNNAKLRAFKDTAVVNTFSLGTGRDMAQETMSIPLGGNVGENEVEDNRLPFHRQEDDSDDDIAIIAEIDKHSQTVTSPRILGASVSDKGTTSARFETGSAPGTMCFNISRRDCCETGRKRIRLQSSSASYCGVCNTEFSCGQELDHHMERVHQIIVLDSCETCGKVFKESDQLSRQETPMHDSGKPYTFDAMELTGGQRSEMPLIMSATSVAAEPQPQSLVPAVPVVESVALLPYSIDRNDTIERRRKIPSRATSSPKTFICKSITGISSESFPERNTTPPMILPSSQIIVNTSNSSQQNVSLHDVQHGFDAAKSLSGNFSWCVCGSKYSSRNSLNLHVRGQTEQTKLICGFCNKLYSSFPGIKKHMEACHRGGF